jgi:glycosyltransferase involved in cell wall biosynthesis
VIVLIPAYEPDGRLLELVTALRAADPAVRPVVVDDGSGAGFRSLFDAVEATGVTVLRHRVNRGKGAALKTGFAHACSHHPHEDVVCADSDGQHTVGDVLRVAAQVQAGGALVLGSRRFTGSVPARSRLGNSVTRVLFRLATGLRIQDTQTGLRGYSAALLPWLGSMPGYRFEYELNILLSAARRRQRIKEIDIATIYLEGNASSHFRPVVDSLRVYAPLLAFVLSSLGAFLVDVVALLVLHTLTGALLISVVGARAISA